MQAFKFNFLSCQTVNFLTNDILWTFLSSQSKTRKPIDNARVILKKIHLSLFTASLRRLFPFIYSRHLTILGSCYCKKQIDVSFLCVCPLIGDKFRYNIVKVYCGTTRLRLVVPQPL